MTKSSHNQTSSLFTSIWNLVLLATKRRKRDYQSDHVHSDWVSRAKEQCEIAGAARLHEGIRTSRFCDWQYPKDAECREAAIAFRNAAALEAAAGPSYPADDDENQRLAAVLRGGKKELIAKEPELRSAVMMLDLARDYFSGRAGANGKPLEVAQVTCALRNILANEICRGARPELKPAFKQEYIAFQREWLARGRTGATCTTAPADRRRGR